MTKKIIIIIFLLLMSLVAIPAQAQTITIANPGSIAERDIIVYHPNGTMYGFYNTTSVIRLDGSSDYIFTLKPTAGNVLDDPRDFLNQGFDFVNKNAVYLIVGAAILALLLRKW